LPEFVPQPFGNSKQEDFSLLNHVRLYEPKPKEPKEEKEKKKGGKKEEEEEEEEDDAEAGGGYDENKVYKRIVIPGICKLWVQVKPNLDLFFQDIVRCIGEGLNAIQAFERWSRHDDMTQYVSVLEEWDNIVGEDWDHLDSNYLNPQDWLDSSPFETFSGMVR
jgi:dynein heavy chain